MNDIPAQCDVLVVGGGPSGSTAASLLADKGYDVVMLEKETFPRPHVGESLIPYFWRFCDAIGVSDKIEQEKFIRKSGGIVTWQNQSRKVSFKQFGFDRPALHVERDIFDKLLFDHAKEKNAFAFDSVLVKEIVQKDGYADIVYKAANDSDKGQIRAKYVVDCSGQNALMASQHGFREFDEEFRFVALWGYFTGGSYLDFDENIRPFSQVRDIPPVTTIDSIGEWGWAWHIPMRHETSVGLVLEKRDFQRLKKIHGDLRSIFLAVIEQSSVFSKLLSDATLSDAPINAIKDYSYKPSKLYHGNCFITGDAAAFVDPINSAGVTFGMYGSYMAAWAIENALKSPDKLPYFQTFFDKLYRARLDIFRLIAFPDNTRDIDEFSLGSDMLTMHSETDIQLMLSAAAMISRKEGIEKLLHSVGIQQTECNFVKPVNLNFA